MDSIPSHQPERFDSESQSDSLISSNALSQPNGHKSQSKDSNSRKRPRSTNAEEDDDSDDITTLLPAATAMKKRRLEIEKENRRKGITTDDKSHSRSQLDTSEPSKKTRPKRKELDVLEAARECREREEEAARVDRENLAAELEGMDVEDMRNLAVIEEMEVPIRTDRPTASDIAGGVSERWDERWNGRKNFKKFRCARDRDANGAAPRQRMQAVIVPLVEVKKKDYGIGQDYWDDDRKSKDKGKRRQEKGSQTQKDSLFDDISSVPAKLRSRSKKPQLLEDSNPGDTLPQNQELEVIDVNASDNDNDKNNLPSPFTTAKTQLEEEAASILGEEVDVHQPRTTRAQEREKTTSPAKTRETAAKGKGRGKRVADEEAETVSKAKKVKTIAKRKGKAKAAEDDGDSDEEGGLKFRFKRRR
jgi:nibrin